MAYQVVDLENKVLLTLENDEQLKDLLAKAETNEFEHNLFWDDEGLVETLKAAAAEDDSHYAIIKLVEE